MAESIPVLFFTAASEHLSNRIHAQDSAHGFWFGHTTFASYLNSRWSIPCFISTMERATTKTKQFASWITPYKPVYKNFSPFCKGLLNMLLGKHLPWESGWICSRIIHSLHIWRCVQVAGSLSGKLDTMAPTEVDSLSSSLLGVTCRGSTSL